MDGMDKNFLAHFESKERSANFTKAEMDRLQNLLTKHKNILFCKKTDGISSKQKESAWHLIECEFNALADTPRTIKQLKYKFEHIKRVAKKGAGKERQEMRRTGGGPSPPPLPGSQDATDWLRSIIPASIDGNEAMYDDDTLSQKTVFPAKKLDEDHNISIEIVDECVTEESHHSKIPANEVGTGINEASSSKKWDFDPSTPYSSLKRPMSTPLKRRAKKEKMAENGNLVRQLLREKKISIMDNLQELALKKIKESIRHAQEVHDQKLRHNAERHQLELEKLKLDIAILKKNLDF